MAGSGGLAYHAFERRVAREPNPPPEPISEVRLSEADRGRIARTVEGEVIPRLLLLHRRPADCGPDVPPGAADVAQFARMLLSDEPGAASDFVVVLQAKGASLETVFLQLFAPAARVLGDLWREDLATFAEVTIGLSRLQSILQTLRDDFEQDSSAPWNGRRALLAPTPGEQHSFGLSVIEAFLRRQGWHVEALWGASEGEIIREVRDERYDIAGFSLSCDVLLDRLTATIESVRRASLNRALKVLVGGRIFVAHPDKVAVVGADAGALDARDATRQADRLVKRAVWLG